MFIGGETNYQWLMNYADETIREINFFWMKCLQLLFLNENFLFLVQ